MKSDREIREDVIRELRWDHRILNPEAIGVAVTDGAVTLTGDVSTYGEKLAAAEAAERVYGVKAVANDVRVQLGTTRRSDTEIAKAIAHILEWNTNIPTGRVKARVQNGLVTLEGTVDYAYQRDEVERMVRHVRDVLGVTNTIEVRPPVSPEEVESKIAETLRRNAELDARRIRVEVSDHTALLYGHVHSIHEANAARAAAESAPGIAKVEDHLTIEP
jgi:osmotically-inducible protein OsmY